MRPREVEAGAQAGRPPAACRPFRPKARTSCRFFFGATWFPVMAGLSGLVARPARSSTAGQQRSKAFGPTFPRDTHGGGVMWIRTAHEAAPAFHANRAARI